MAGKAPNDERPMGKHKNTDTYAQTNVYLPIEVKKLVKIELLKAEGGGELSELVETLLCDWLKQRGVRVPSTRKTGKR
jgi:hypothetical protein